MAKSPKVSIVTITYNAEATLERTMESVERQDYGGIEYIVIDGKSKDGTMGIVERHRGMVNRCVSEPDKGLYDAMNKGLRLSTGDYVWFLNAGDELRSEDTVSRMLEVACGGEGEGEWPDVIYGETVITDMDGNEIGTRRLETPEELNADSFKRGMLVCHQAFVAKMAICEEYDTQYRLSADFEWCLSILERSKRTVNSRMTLVRFLDGGITKHNIPTALRERFKIMCKHYGVLSTVWHHIPIAAKFVWYVVRKGRF